MSQTTRATLPRNARLRGHDTFGRIFRTGHGMRRGDLVLKYVVDEPGAGRVRAGFVVRRGTGSAVRRNKLRRLMREAYRVRRSALAGRVPGRDIAMVFVWSGSGAAAERPELAVIGAHMDAALETLCKRLGRRADGTTSKDERIPAAGSSV